LPLDPTAWSFASGDTERTLDPCQDASALCNMLHSICMIIYTT